MLLVVFPGLPGCVLNWKFPETSSKSPLKNRWLEEDLFLLEQKAYFQKTFAVSFRECFSHSKNGGLQLPFKRYVGDFGYPGVKLWGFSKRSYTLGAAAGKQSSLTVFFKGLGGLNL